MVRLLAEQSGSKSNVKLGGFQSQLKASCVSPHTEELWCNETVCLWMRIIMSCYQYGYPWPSLATLLYRTLLPAGLQDYISYRHRAAVCRFLLVFLPLFVHVKRSTGVHYMCSSLFLQYCRAYLVRLTLIVFAMGGKWPYCCYFVGCCFQDLFCIARSILM